MTQSEQDLQRIKAWDDYKAAQVSFTLHKADLQQLGGKIAELGRKLKDGPSYITDADLQPLPPPDKLRASVSDFQSALEALKRARELASKLAFPIDPEDLQGI